MNKRGALKNGPKYKKIDDHAQGYILETTLTNYMWQELAIIEDSVDASIRRLKGDVKKGQERLIAADHNSNVKTKRKITQTGKQIWEEK